MQAEIRSAFQNAPGHEILHGAALGMVIAAVKRRAVTGTKRATRLAGYSRFGVPFAQSPMDSM